MYSRTDSLSILKHKQAYNVQGPFLVTTWYW